MKAIGVPQPWADLVLRGIADVVKLPFTDAHRGRTALCATNELVAWESAAFYAAPRRLEQRGLIGVVDVIDVVSRHPSSWSYPDDEGSVWVLSRPIRLPFKSCRTKKLGVFEVEEPEPGSANEPRRNEVPPVHPKIVCDPICALAARLDVDSLRDIAESLNGPELPGEPQVARRAFVTHFRGRAGDAIAQLGHDELVRMMRACGDEPGKVKDNKLREQLGEIFWGGVPEDEPYEPFRPRDAKDDGELSVVFDEDDSDDDDD